MKSRTFQDLAGRFDVSIDVYDRDLEVAIGHDAAEAVLRSAMLLAFAALAQSDEWPSEALQSMSSFMSDMRDRLLQ